MSTNADLLRTEATILENKILVAVQNYEAATGQELAYVRFDNYYKKLLIGNLPAAPVNDFYIMQPDPTAIITDQPKPFYQL